MMIPINPTCVRSYSKNREKLAEEEHYGEEGQPEYKSTISLDELVTRVLTRIEAGECLHNLGKCNAQDEYAYLSLDVSDRGLTDISVITSFKHVRFVNVSGNRLTSEALKALEAIPYLQTLRADRNHLTSIELKPMPYLQVIPSFLNLCSPWGLNSTRQPLRPYITADPR